MEPVFLSEIEIPYEKLGDRYLFKWWKAKAQRLKAQMRHRLAIRSFNQVEEKYNALALRETYKALKYKTLASKEINKKKQLLSQKDEIEAQINNLKQKELLKKNQPS